MIRSQNLDTADTGDTERYIILHKSLSKHQCGHSSSILSILSTSSSMADTVYQFTVDTIDGAAVRLDTYRGRVLCIVNVASR